MKSKKLTRRILQYAAGLIIMAIGIVFLKRTEWGVSPVTTVPDAVAIITPLTLGNTTILLHFLCVLVQILIQKRVTLKSILTMCVGVPFGYLVDFFLWIFAFPLDTLQKVPIMILGVAFTGLGITLISGSDMMLPAPDELNNVISRVYGRKLSNVKIVMDAFYVVIAILINLISTHSLASVGISSILSVLFTGRFVGLFGKLLPWAHMEPFFSLPQRTSK